MPSWRLAHHGKATAALRAVELGYHAAVMDLDVYLAEGDTRIYSTAAGAAGAAVHAYLCS
jgi:hypothetical protein